MSNKIYSGSQAATILRKALGPRGIENLKQKKVTELQKTKQGRNKIKQMVLLGSKKQTKSGQKASNLCITQDHPTIVKSCKLVATARARQKAGILNKYTAKDAAESRKCKKNATKKCTPSQRTELKRTARRNLGKPSRSKSRSASKTKKNRTRASTPNNARRSARLAAKK
jgi:hypothetical protein